jgi:tetratricopeptide (TPR) repeat protein
MIPKKIPFLVVLLLNLFIVPLTSGQSLTEKIASKACEYLESVDDFQVLQDSIQPSIVAAMSEIMVNGTAQERELISTSGGIKEILRESLEILPSYCNNVRSLILEDKKNTFYRRSENPQANSHFDKGNELMEKGNFKKAIKQFESAVEYDSNFVFAIDHLAISHRRLEEFTTAITYYKQSLDIYPEGDLALMNLAVLYSFLEDYDKSIENYALLKDLYPDNPEGYFGLARVYLLTEDFENSLDNLFISYIMYSASNSPYLKDAEQLLSKIYGRLQELNKTDILDKIAKAHDITISM